MKRIAVAGNPNSGKTCVFNNLTGSNQRVGNYAGVTVEYTEGYSQFGGEKVKVIDLPGTYSLTAYSQEEVVARDFIINEKPDVVINVLDASNFERNLYLTTQLLELNVPLVLVLNMYDIAEKKGIVIDTELLGQILGVKVVKSIANKREGMDDIKAACLETIMTDLKPKALSYPHEINKVIPSILDAVKAVPEITKKYNPLWFTIKLLEDDDIIVKSLKNYTNCKEIEEEVARAKSYLLNHSDVDGNTAVVEARYAFAAGAYREVVKTPKEEIKMLTNIADSIVCHKFFGWVILAAVIYSMFQFVFEISSELQWIPVGVNKWTSPVGLFEMGFEYIASFANGITTPWLNSLIVDGIIGGIGGVMGFIPLIFFMFLFLSILEDSGYIARMAFVLDRILRSFGLQGKSILALIISGGIPGGCAVPGIMATRTLREEKDRLITILVAPFMNCGAKMPVYGILIAAFFPNKRGLMLTILFLLSWVFALTSAIIIRKFIVKGEQTPFVMELPLYHMPTLRGVMMDTGNRTWMYIKKAATVILAINIILWAMMYYPRNDASIFINERANATQNIIEKMNKSEYASIITKDNISNVVEAYNNARGDELTPKQYKKLFEDMNSSLPSQAAMNFSEYIGKLTNLANKQAQAQLSNSIAGRLGTALAPVSKYAGFDWRDNIALIGGFAAKEVIVSTLGTAYSMGTVDVEETTSLREQLQKDKSWSPLRAFAMMIFVMVYAPCFVTIAAIKKETGSWKWAFFSMGYNTMVGLVLAITIYQVGGLF